MNQSSFNSNSTEKHVLGVYHRCISCSKLEENFSSFFSHENFQIFVSIYSCSQSILYSTARMVCPPSDKIPDKCRTCCCRSSDNVHFLHPDESPAPCEASETATYKLTLKSDYNPECHPDYVVPPGLEEGQFPYFTRPIVTTNRARRVMTTCNVAANILRFVENIDHTPAQLINEIINVTHNVPLAHRYALPSPESVLSYRLRRRVMFFSATPSTAYATVVSKLVR